MQPLRENQTYSIEFGRDKPEVFDMSEPGCVSADTEYLTPIGWKRFDTYTDGDVVAQFHPDSREIEFVPPTEYIKRPCERMIAIAPIRGMSQRLSPEHRMLCYFPDGKWQVVPAQDLMDRFHVEGRVRYQPRFATTFSVRNSTSLPFSDEELRIMVAAIADGHFPCKTPRCTVRLKRIRKIIRLRRLLAEAGIEYIERTCGGRPDFQVFRFNAPRRDRSFSSFYWAASQHQLELVADEIQHWDGSIDRRPGAGCRFTSYSKNSAEFAQYAFAAAKRPASLQIGKRGEAGEVVGYSVHAEAGERDAGPGREAAIHYVSNPEGFKYCFEVPSSFLLLRHNGYIFATGNTGKTRVAIELFKPRIASSDKSVLVLGPKTALRSAWGNDLRKFAPELSWSIANAENRAKAFAIPADFYLTNHDAARWLAAQPKKFFDKFCGLIIDESGAYKHHTSQRSKAINKIADRFDFRQLLNGTPNSNSILDIWNQAYVLDRGKRLGRSYYAFRSAVCLPESGVFLRWVDKPGIEPAVASLLRDISIRHRLEDCADLPPNHEYVVPYYLGEAQAQAYEEMRKKGFAELASGEISAINASAVATKLQQIASGAVYESEFRYHIIDTGRYELIADLVEARKNSLVFFLWKHQKDLLIAEFVRRGLTYCVIDGEVSQKDRDKNVEQFEAGYYRCALLHPASAAHALTLVRAKAAIWATPTYNAEHFLQGNRRNNRIGQTERTETIVVLAPETIDGRIYHEVLGPKREKLSTLLEEMRHERATVL